MKGLYDIGRKILISTAVILLTATASYSVGLRTILGTWKTETGESKVSIFACGENLCGKIIWLQNPIYTDSSDGILGTPLIDRNNPDPTLRSRPVLGLLILQGFTAEDDTTWVNGTCYDPDSGNTYRGRIHLVAPNRLELRGYIGISLLGRTSVWTR